MCVIDAMEACNVATVDIPGAFTQDKVVDMRLHGEMAKLVTQMDPHLIVNILHTSMGSQ